MNLAIIAFIAFIAGAISIYLILRGWYHIHGRITGIETRLAEEERNRGEVEKKLHDLETGNGVKKCYQYNTKAAAMDITAHAVDLEFEIACRPDRSNRFSSRPT